MGGWDEGARRLSYAVLVSAALHLAVAQQLSLFPNTNVGSSTPVKTLTVALLQRTPSGMSLDGAAISDDSRPRIADTPVPRSSARDTHNADSGPAPAQLQIGKPPRYFLGSELDKRPVLLTRFDPDYPAAARATGGRVVLRLMISERGQADFVFIQETSSRDLDGSALTAFGSARFSPGLRDGAAVKSQMLLELTYHPIDSNDGGTRLRWLEN